jgi:hypothetical protein
MSVISLGRRMYLHKMGVGFATRVLITAHGGIDKKKQPKFTLPSGVSVRFFTIHGTVLPDPGVNTVLEGAKLVEEITGGSCFNYELSKYQGRHGGSNGKPAETYESIAKSQANFAKLEGSFKSNVDPVVNKATYEGVDSLSKAERGWWKMACRRMEEYGQLYKDDCDVVTIRNRVFSIGEITLKDVIKATRDVNPGYDTYECSFCRSYME